MTQLVAAGSAVVAVLLGVVFAQQSSGDTGSTQTTNSGPDSSTDNGTGNDSGTWQAPGSGDGSSAHGSTGAS